MTIYFHFDEGTQKVDVLEPSNMAAQQHRPSFDIASFQLHSTARPPTYHASADSTYVWEDEKHRFSASGHPTGTHQSKSTDEENAPSDFEVKPDPHDTNHPLYVDPSTTTMYQPPRPAQRRLPRRRKIFLWAILALLSLLILYFGTLVLSAKLLHALHLHAPSQTITTTVTTTTPATTSIPGETTSPEDNTGRIEQSVSASTTASPTNSVLLLPMIGGPAPTTQSAILVPMIGGPRPTASPTTLARVRRSSSRD